MFFYIKFFFLFSKTSHLYVYSNLFLLHKNINLKHFFFLNKFINNITACSLNQINLYRSFFQNTVNTSLPSSMVNLNNSRFLYTDKNRLVGNKLTFLNFFKNTNIAFKNSYAVSDIFEYLSVYSNCLSSSDNTYLNFSKKFNTLKFNSFVLLLGAN